MLCVKIILLSYTKTKLFKLTYLTLLPFDMKCHTYSNGMATLFSMGHLLFLISIFKGASSGKVGISFGLYCTNVNIFKIEMVDL